MSPPLPSGVIAPSLLVPNPSSKINLPSQIISVIAHPPILLVSDFNASALLNQTITITSFPPSVDDGGPIVSPSAANIIGLTVVVPCFAGIQIGSSGAENSTPTNGDQNYTLSRGNWLDRGASSDVWVDRIITLGSFNSEDAGAGRLNLGGTRQFRVVRSTIGTNTTNCTFNYYDAATGGNLIGSVSLVFTAELSG